MATEAAGSSEGPLRAARTCALVPHRLSLLSVRKTAPWLLAAAVLLAPCWVRADELAWRPFESASGRFRVLLPAAPVPTNGTFRTQGQSVPETGIEVAAAGLVLKIEHHDLPRLASLLLSQEHILDLATAGLLDDRHGRLESESAISMRGQAGRMVRYTRTDLENRPEQARLVLVGRRLYIAVARTDGKGDAREQIARFFDSFEVWED